jgi:hypothetical protein
METSSLDDFDNETKAKIDNSLFYSSLAGGDPNDVYDYTDKINEQVHGGSNNISAFNKNQETITKTTRTLTEKLKNFNIIDALSLLPFSPLYQYAKIGAEAAKEKLA